MPNKDLYFGSHLFIHVLIVCLPWFPIIKILSQYMLIDAAIYKSVLCFGLEFATHYHIDWIKTGFLKRHKNFINA